MDWKEKKDDQQLLSEAGVVKKSKVIVLQKKDLVENEENSVVVVVEYNGEKFEYPMNKEEEFIDLEKAFFLTALEWSSSSQTLRVQVHFWINEYGNMMIQEASSSVDTNSRRKFCSIYSRNLRQDGILCNVQDEASRQLQQ